MTGYVTLLEPLYDTIMDIIGAFEGKVPLHDIIGYMLGNFT
jgi:hypothetical protein